MLKSLTEGGEALRRRVEADLNMASRFSDRNSPAKACTSMLVHPEAVLTESNSPPLRIKCTVSGSFWVNRRFCFGDLNKRAKLRCRRACASNSVTEAR
jgi:hypothetical protein